MSSCKGMSRFGMAYENEGVLGKGALSERDLADFSCQRVHYVPAKLGFAVTGVSSAPVRRSGGSPARPDRCAGKI